MSIYTLVSFPPQRLDLQHNFLHSSSSFTHSTSIFIPHLAQNTTINLHLPNHNPRNLASSAFIILVKLTALGRQHDTFSLSFWPCLPWTSKFFLYHNSHRAFIFPCHPILLEQNNKQGSYSSSSADHHSG